MNKIKYPVGTVLKNIHSGEVIVIVKIDMHAVDIYNIYYYISQEQIRSRTYEYQINLDNLYDVIFHPEN